MDIIRRNCPICDATNDTVYCQSNIDYAKLDEYAFASRKYPECMRHRLMHCPTCDVVYADPAPTQKLLQQEYEAALFDSSEEARCAAHTYASYLPKGLKFGKALDIGTGGGEFLSELCNYGFSSVEGIEPSPAAITTADPSIKPYIRQGVFVPEQYLPETYAFISCFQTLEHVADPLMLSRACYKALVPGGVYFIVSHNISGGINRLLGTRSPIFDIEHLQLFSPQSITKLMKKSGFEQVQLFPIWNRYPLHYWVKLLPLPKAFTRQIIRLLKAMKIGYIKIPMNVGNIGVMAFK